MPAKSEESHEGTNAAATLTDEDATNADGAVRLDQDVEALCPRRDAEEIESSGGELPVPQAQRNGELVEQDVADLVAVLGDPDTEAP